MATPTDMLTGSIHPTRFNGDLIILDYTDSHTILVRFIDTGYEVITTSSHIRDGNLKDLLKPTVYGSGYLGVGKYQSSANGKQTLVYARWLAMRARCSNAETYPTYIGCSVDPRWDCFQDYAKWDEENYIEGYELDKDKLVPGNKVYGPDTCCFISPQENVEIALAKTYRFLSPQGEAVEIYNLKKFCRENNLHSGNMYSVDSGNRGSHKGWTKA